MKSFQILLILSAPFIGLCQSPTSHIIYASDYMIFSPSELTIIEGDTVYFENLTSHNAVEVSEETYNNNGIESNGGFELYVDDFVVFEEAGIHYYVCTPHVQMNMKGKITVSENQYTYVPDNNFEQALIDLGYDDVLDNYVNTSAIDTIIELHITNQLISDLTGIENFLQLTYLDCRYNSLTSLDVSNNFNLENLFCNNNQITDIDLTNNDSLVWLQIPYNNLSTLDVSANEKLEKLNCEFSNIINLNLNDSLEYLYCFYNQISTLNISNNHNLVYLACNNNEMSTLDVSHLQNLDELYCSGNQLVELDLRNGTNSSMTTMIAFDNPLLNCINVDDVEWAENNWNSENYNIDESASFSLDCQNDQGEASILGQWYANIGDYLQITTDSFFIYIFEEEDCYEFEEYYYELNDNSLTLLDGDEEIEFEIFNISEDSFSIILGGESVEVVSTTFSTSKWIECEDNKYFWDCSNIGCIEMMDGNGEFSSLGECEFECEEINEQKTYVPDNNFEQALIDLGYDNFLDDSVVTSNISSIGELDVSSKSISDLTGIQDFISLYHLDCYDNQLSTLELSCPEIEYVNCNDNLISNLNIESIFLIELRCSNIPLLFFDATIYTDLRFLEIFNTDIYNIDLSQNLELQFLSIGSNSNLLSLDLSNNYNLQHLDLWANYLSELDLRNGNNQNIEHFVSWTSQNLNCISVDDSFYSTENWTSIDSWTYFSDNCDKTTSYEKFIKNKEIIIISDLLGRKSNQINKPQLYIYDNGSYEKKITIE